MIGRRGFMAVLGGGVILAAGAGGWAATRDPAAARAAWEMAGTGYDDARMRWLSWANPDGISLVGPVMEGLGLAGLISRESMADPTSSGFKSMLDAMKPPFDTAMGFFWIATPGNDRQAQIAAGRAYVRANLAAAGEGIAIQPFSQALQEFPEMRASYDELAAALGAPDGLRVQMFVRAGFAPMAKGSPRWPLASRVVPA